MNKNKSKKQITLSKIIFDIKDDILIKEENKNVFSIHFLKQKNNFLVIKNNKISKIKVSKKNYNILEKYTKDNYFIVDDYF